MAAAAFLGSVLAAPCAHAAPWNRTQPLKTRLAQAAPDALATGAGHEGHDHSDGGGEAALSPLPVDLGAIRRLRVAGAEVSEAPMRVGNLDILAPMGEAMAGLGVMVSRVSPENVPGNINAPTNDQLFQINLYNPDPTRPTDRPPIVLSMGKPVAYIDGKPHPLRAAPLVLRDPQKGDRIWLPIYSLAPLLGAACRLDPNGTLFLSPTIQSVELFQVRGVTVLTVKASAPFNERGVVKGSLSGREPKVYLDFPGFSMGFDAAFSTNERTLAAGLAEVSRVRSGLFEKFPDTTRVVLDLKKRVPSRVVPLPDRSLYALELQGAAQPSLATGSVGAGPTLSQVVPGVPGSLRGLTIVVDAGHGGSKPGARGARSWEKTHTLDISRRLRKSLEERGATVLMTRDSDVHVDNYWRPAFANQRGADLFISVHINSYGPRSTGTETYYATGHSLAFAREVHKELLKATGLTNRGVLTAKHIVTRLASMPAILTETCFISNPREEALLMQDGFRQRVAGGMAQGIQNYVDKYMRRAVPG